MSSIAAGMSVPNHALYAGSKSAVEGFTRSFAADGGPKRITANAIAPGGIKTDMFEQNAWHYAPGATKDTPIETIEAGIAKLIPLGRCAVPADIARVVMFLCHDDSEWLNGKACSSFHFHSYQGANIETYRSNHPSQRRWFRINDFTSPRFAMETSSSVTYISSTSDGFPFLVKSFLGLANDCASSHLASSDCSSGTGFRTC